MNLFSIMDALFVVISDTLSIIRQNSVNTILTPAKVEPDRHGPQLTERRLPRVSVTRGEVAS